MRLSDFDYALPEQLIAQAPIEKRDQSRLLVVDRPSETIEHRAFADLPDYLRDDDLMVFNDTRVVAARLIGRKQTGGRVEALLLRRLAPATWDKLLQHKQFHPD